MVLDFAKALDGITLNEEQIAALDKFFTDWQEKKTGEIRKAVLEEVSTAPEVDLAKYVLIEDAEKAFGKFQEDSDQTFALFEQNCEAAFDLFEEHCQEAFKMGMEDLQTEYTENMTQALAAVYPEVQERVKQDFLESDEYKVVQEMKRIVLPLLNEDSEIVAKMKALEEDNKKVTKTNQELERENTITTLMKDIPGEFAEEVKEFISGGKTNDEVIERFHAILEIVEKKITGEDVPVTEDNKTSGAYKRKKITAPKSEPVKPVDNKPITEETEPVKGNDGDKANPSVNYETLIADAKKKESDGGIQPFTEEFKGVMDYMFRTKKQTIKKKE